jgi:hypothetical protein
VPVAIDFVSNKSANTVANTCTNASSYMPADNVTNSATNIFSYKRADVAANNAVANIPSDCAISVRLCDMGDQHKSPRRLPCREHGNRMLGSRVRTFKVHVQRHLPAGERSR